MLLSLVRPSDISCITLPSISLAPSRVSMFSLTQSSKTGQKRYRWKLTEVQSDKLYRMSGHMLLKQVDVVTEELHTCLHDAFVLHILDGLYRGFDAYKQAIDLIFVQSATTIEWVGEPLHDTYDGFDLWLFRLHLLHKLDEHHVLGLHSEFFKAVLVVQETY